MEKEVKEMTESGIPPYLNIWRVFLFKRGGNVRYILNESLITRVAVSGSKFKPICVDQGVPGLWNAVLTVIGRSEFADTIPHTMLRRAHTCL